MEAILDIIKAIAAVVLLCMIVVSIVRAVRGIPVRIKYFEGAQPIAKIAIGDWIDLRANKTMMLRAGEFALIPLGIAMKLPNGYEAYVAPRSSTFKNYHILQTNSVGIIDNSYCGDNDEWKMPVYAVEDTVISKGDRICQFRIERKQERIKFVEVDKLSANNRGGFGSTGVK